MAQRTIGTSVPIDLTGTLAPLCRGHGDPTMRVGVGEVWRTIRTPDGPATLQLCTFGYDVRAEAWGPGADVALLSASDLIGANDDVGGFEPKHDAIAELWRRHPGVRLTRSGGVMHVLIPTILEQKVTGIEARRAYRAMVLATSEPAPGPSGLLLPPDPAVLSATPYFSFQPWGVEQRRAETIRSSCAQATRLEAAADLPLEEAKERLSQIPGVGPWTVAEVARLALGDADAVSIGDFHLANDICWALAGEARGTDERMLELLEPYRGHRGRVQVLIEAGGITAPKFGPRVRPGAIEHL